MAGWSVWTWVVVLLGYSRHARFPSWPVWTLLSLRDYATSLQLISAPALIVLGLVAAAFAGGSEGGELTMVAPAFEARTPRAAPMIFSLPLRHHCLRGGKRLSLSGQQRGPAASRYPGDEPDARFVGLREHVDGRLSRHPGHPCLRGRSWPGGVVSAGGEALSGEAAWSGRFPASWGPAKGLRAPKCGAFVDRLELTLITPSACPPGVAVALMGVLVASLRGNHPRYRLPSA